MDISIFTSDPNEFYAVRHRGQTQEVEQLFSKLENLKHKTMLFLAYSAGLRVSEIVNLRIKDIHSERMVINIKGAKGKKDRIVSLSEGI